MPTSWKGVQRNFSSHTWSMGIIAVWNKEAKQLDWWLAKLAANTAKERGPQKQFELKCSNWKLCYTDGSCIGKAKHFAGAGVYCPQTNTECYVDSGGVRMTNTINRAELTGIAAALTNKLISIPRLQRAVHAPEAKLENHCSSLKSNEPIYTQIC